MERISAAAIMAARPCYDRDTVEKRVGYGVTIAEVERALATRDTRATPGECAWLMRKFGGYDAGDIVWVMGMAGYGLDETVRALDTAFNDPETIEQALADSYTAFSIAAERHGRS